MLISVFDVKDQRQIMTYLYNKYQRSMAKDEK